MFKFILFALIFILISSKEVSSGINYAVDIPFNIINYYISFEFDYDGSIGDPLIIYIQPDYDDLIFIYYPKSAGYYTSMWVTLEGYGILVQADSIDIYLEAHYLERFNGTGKFWINPCNNEIQIDLSEKKYGKMIPITGNKMDVENITTYVVTNLKKDYNITFQYQKEIKLNDNYFNISNPFVVCSENECLGNVTNYIFTKEKSYKIILKAENILDTIHYVEYTCLPAYTFYEEKDDRKDGEV